MFLFLATTITGFLSVHSSSLTKVIAKCFNTISTEERQLISERAILCKQLSALSVNREFVKYIRIQRRINAIDEVLEDSRSECTTNSFIYNIGFNYGVKILVSLFVFFLTVYYRNVPVFIIEDKYDLFPFGGLISFPNGIVNAVSVHFWMICCSSVARIIKF